MDKVEVLTVLIKGDDEIKNRILRELGRDHFSLPGMGLVFEYAVRSFKSRGKVEITDLYRDMEEHVRNHWLSDSDPAYDGSQYSAEQVLPGYLAVIDHILAIEMPDDDTLDKAIDLLKIALIELKKLRNSRR